MRGGATVRTPGGSDLSGIDLDIVLGVLKLFAGFVLAYPDYR